MHLDSNIPFDTNLDFAIALPLLLCRELAPIHQNELTYMRVGGGRCEAAARALRACLADGVCMMPQPGPTWVQRLTQKSLPKLGVPLIIEGQ